MHATGAGQAHDVERFAVLLGIGVGIDNLGVLEDRAVLNTLIDLDQILIDDASATNV